DGAITRSFATTGPTSSTMSNGQPRRSARRTRRGPGSQFHPVEDERLVVVPADSGDLLEQLRSAAGVQEIATRLAGNVAAEVVAALSERRRLLRLAVDHRRPPLFGCSLRFDRGVPVVAQVDERFGDEVDLV